MNNINKIAAELGLCRTCGAALGFNVLGCARCALVAKRRRQLQALLEAGPGAQLTGRIVDGRFEVERIEPAGPRQDGDDGWRPRGWSRAGEKLALFAVRGGTKLSSCICGPALLERVIGDDVHLPGCPEAK